MSKTYRNGDWTFVPTDKKMEGETQKHNGKFIFAEGEATGHLHTIEVPKVDDMVLTKLTDGSYMVSIKTDAVVAHPEHSIKNDLVVPAGTYMLVQRREKDWFSLATRKIVD